MNLLRRRWEKNWPEIHGALGGGFPAFVFARNPEEPVEIPVFWYHSVRREDLREDLIHLERNGYRTLTADELRDHVEGATRVPPRSVVLTFDDGSVNLHSVVFPF
jgi:peptidoglycan/xylan/chitin deacetylase (PgdA/CDA1 family)